MIFYLLSTFSDALLVPLRKLPLHSTLPVHSKPEPHILGAVGCRSAALGEQSGLFYALAQGHSVVVVLGWPTFPNTQISYQTSDSNFIFLSFASQITTIDQMDQIALVYPKLAATLA